MTKVPGTIVLESTLPDTYKALQESLDITFHQVQAEDTLANSNTSGSFRNDTRFPLFKIKDHDHLLPQEVADKGGWLLYVQRKCPLPNDGVE